MEKEYRYLQILKSTGGMCEGRFKKPYPCSPDYLVSNLLMGIKNSAAINDKVVFLLNPDRIHFCLCYNIVAAIGDVDHPSEEQFEFCKQDSEYVIELALRQIDYVMNFLLCETRSRSATPVIREMDPIKSIEDNAITMNGRLPMLESIFAKRYWFRLAERYHKKNKGIRFNIEFHELGTKIVVTAELCRYNNLRAKSKLLPMEHEDRRLADVAIQEILCDLADAIQECAEDYAEACRNP